MKNILLVLSTAAQSPKAIDVALRKAIELSGKLIVLFVSDANLPSSIFERLEGSTLVGERPGQAVQEALMEEYKRQGEQQLEEIKRRAADQGTETEVILKVGVFADECIAAIREKCIEVAVLTRTRRSQLSRFIFGSPIKNIQDCVECQFEIVDLD
jgi:nucleotide-binding universal stress UspA family protein